MKHLTIITVYFYFLAFPTFATTQVGAKDISWLDDEYTWSIQGVDTDKVESMKQYVKLAVSLLPQDLWPRPVYFSIAPVVDSLSRFEAPYRVIHSFMTSEGHTRIGIAVSIHELGHAIFHDSLHLYAPDVPELSDLYDRVEKRIALFPQLRFYDYEHQHLVNEIANAEEYKDWRRVSLLNNELRNLEKIKSEFNILEESKASDEALYKMMLPYNELWADTLAVVTLGDLEAMVYHFGPTSRGDFRSFLINHDLESWNETDEHTALSPVRSYLGQHVLNNIENMSLERKREVLHSIFLAISKVIASRIDGPYHGAEMSIKEINEGLIKELQNFQNFNGPHLFE